VLWENGNFEFDIDHRTKHHRKMLFQALRITTLVGTIFDAIIAAFKLNIWNSLGSCWDACATDGHKVADAT